MKTVEPQEGSEGSDDFDAWELVAADTQPRETEESREKVKEAGFRGVGSGNGSDVGSCVVVRKGGVGVEVASELGNGNGEVDSSDDSGWEWEEVQVGCVDDKDALQDWEEVHPCEWKEEMDKVLSRDKDDLASLGIKHASVELFARALFYPTVLFNYGRSLVDKDFHWFDSIDKDIWIGAVPFPSDVPLLKSLGITGVVTLTERFETLVESSIYEQHRIEQLWIPTTDYLFAPSVSNIHEALEFIHKHATKGGSTLVHCKAGRARSATIVLCYLVQYKNMTAEAALDRAKSIRKRVKLATAQWQAVKAFSSNLVDVGKGAA